MSDTDDYMSDKILEECSKSDVRPGLLFKQSQKRTHEQQKSKETAKKPKSYQDQEKETREVGLGTALPSTNIGFKLLQKMGYKEGESLGRPSTEGITEPIPVAVREKSGGVGREAHLEEIIAKKEESKEKSLQQKEQEFKQAIAEKNAALMLTRDYHKAQRVCEELDAKSNVASPREEHFWSAATMKRLKGVEDKEEDEEEDDEPEEITSAKLNEIIHYLRSKYFYCLYCGFCTEDEEELNLVCLGPYRADHEDDL